MVKVENNDKEKALELALSQIEKEFGKGSIMRLGSNADVSELDVIPTGIIGLDLALGVGGIPLGRIVEVFGPESSGKTTLTLQIIAQAQKKGGRAAFIDVEHALDPAYAKRLGVDIDNLLISQPDYGEQALEISDILIKSGALEIIVLDSVAALVPKVELDGEMLDNQVGLQARLMSKAMRKLTSAINRSHCTMIFTNQIREKIGVMFGNPETTPGGRALKFYSSIRIDIRKTASIKQGDLITGNQVKVNVVKNKIAPPFRSCNLDILFGEGLSAASSLIEEGINRGIISRSGTWYSFNEERIGQGKDNVRMFLEQNSDVANKIDAKIREIFNQSKKGEAV